MGEIAYWGEMGDERPIATTANEAIRSAIERRSVLDLSDVGDITVCAFRRQRPGESDCGNPLLALLERLDEEYGDPDDWSIKPTPAMQEAEKVFITAVLNEYQAWQCVATGETITVNALQWAKEHEPGLVMPGSADNKG